MCEFFRTAALLLTCCCCLPAMAGEFPSQLRNGLGLDVPIGDRGNFHLTIHERANPEKVGLRLQLRERHFETRVATWSVGPVVKMIRADHGHRYISMFPQLRATVPWAHRQIHASVNYGYWTTDGRRTPVPERTIQAHLTLKF